MSRYVGRHRRPSRRWRRKLRKGVDLSGYVGEARITDLADLTDGPPITAGFRRYAGFDATDWKPVEAVVTDPLFSNRIVAMVDEDGNVLGTIEF